ncbi:hypothetical protein FQZ97_1144460 [compost metagenome]
MQCVSEDHPVGRRPEESDGRRNGPDLCQRPRQHIFEALGKKAECQPEQAYKQDDDDEDDSGDEAKLERLGAFDRIKSHEAAHGILPFRRPPKKGQRKNSAAEGRRKLEEQASLRPYVRQFEIGPEPAQEHADGIAGRQRKA